MNIHMQHMWRAQLEEKDMEEDNRNEEPQMVANYVMLRVKVGTKELITG